ncbi:hypothetical protein TWF281_002087 [Arthrobotrys megalospora]
MGTGTRVAQDPGKYIGDIPPEIHVEILKNLPPLQLLDMIQLVPGIRDGILQWNLSYFTAEQLVYLYQFISNAVEIEAGQERNEQNQIKTADIRSKILWLLPAAIQKYQEISTFPLEANYFNCHYDKLIELAQNNGSGVSDFLWEFHHKNRTVREFCRTLAELDPHGKYIRCLTLIPDEKTRISHLLFWLATEYVSKQSGHKSKWRLGPHWENFVLRVDEIFTPTVSQGFRNCVTNDGVLLLKYRGYISECDEGHLGDIFNAMRMRMRRSDTGLCDFGDYSTYMLSLGLDYALDFLRQCPKKIALMENWELCRILSWRKIWTHFRDVDDMVQFN